MKANHGAFNLLRNEAEVKPFAHTFIWTACGWEHQTKCDGLLLMGCMRGWAHSELSRRRHIQFQQSVIVIKVISTKYAAYLRGVRLCSHCIRVLKLNKSNKSNAASTMRCMFHPVFLQWKITPHLVIQVRWCWYADILLTMTGWKLLAVWSELKIKINCKWKVERSYTFCQIHIKQPEFRPVIPNRGSTSAVGISGMWKDWSYYKDEIVCEIVAREQRS